MKDINKKTIAVLFGGCSPEYGVSLHSAAGVIRNIDTEKYDLVLVGITSEGEWFLYEGTIDNIENDSWHQYCSRRVTLYPDRKSQSLMAFSDEKTELIHIDAVFPVLHGGNGEDGTVQGMFELAGIPVIGCGVLSSALCMDKDRAHKLVGEAGIRIPKSFVLHKSSETDEAIIWAEKTGFPLFVKPIRAGSSFGITKVSKTSEVPAAIAEAFKYDTQVIIEEGISGFEVGCAVMGTDELVVGEVDEIELSDGFFDFTEKYTLKSSSIHVPARLADKVRDEIRETAKKIYRALDCSVFARVDMFYTEDGEIVFNEVNTIPGFTEHSRFPGMMKQTGRTMKDITDYIIGQVVS